MLYLEMIDDSYETETETAGSSLRSQNVIPDSTNTVLTA